MPPTIPPASALLRSLRLTLSSNPPPSPISPITTTHHLASHPHPHHPSSLHRTFHTSPHNLFPPSSAPTTHDRGPASKETTQTDFSALDIYTHSPPPTAQIDACLSDGFHLSNGVKIGNGDGLLLVGGEAFAWTPWSRRRRSSNSNAPPHDNQNMVNAKGQWIGAGEDDWGLLGLVWPKPELLILGVGGRMMPLGMEARRVINGMGVGVDVQDTRNAAAQFNLLATERGVGGVAAALVPVGWQWGGGR